MTLTIVIINSDAKLDDVDCVTAGPPAWAGPTQDNTPDIKNSQKESGSP